MKRFLALFLYIPFCFADQSYFNQFSQQWLTSYILDENRQLAISAHDYHALANLLYYSYARSAQTLKSQRITHQSLHTSWKAWANICATRLNPSMDTPFNLLPENTDNLKLVQNAFDRHTLANKQYVQIIDKIVDGDCLQSSLAKKAVAQLRSEARTIISNSLLNVKHHINVLTEAAKKKKNPALTQETTRFLENIFPALYAFGIKSFVEADTASLKVSNDAWDLLMQTQEASLYIWQTIEQARATFYKTIYNQLRAALPERSIESQIEPSRLLPVKIED